MVIQSFKVKKVVCNGCSLVLARDEDPDEWKHSTVMIINQIPEMQFSIGMKVEKIERGTDDEGLIYVDQRKSGPLENGETVLVKPYRVPKAEHISVLISDRYRLPTGDWSEIVKASILGKVFDFGDEISFLIPSKILTTPYVVTGVIQNSLPKPPFEIAEKTKITLEKQSEQRLLETKSAAYENKGIRAKMYIMQLKEEGLFEALGDLKANLFDVYSQIFDVNVKPTIVHEGLTQLLSGYKIVTDEIREIENAFFGSVVAVGSYEALQPTVLIEIHVSGKDNSGKLQLWVYSKTEGCSRRIIREDLLEKIRVLAKSVEDKVEVVILACKGCGKQLNWRQADEQGYVQCSYCQALNRLPLRFRTV